MHSEIEKLVTYSLVDGIISEKEKSVIFNKAKELNISTDEVEIYLESKIFLQKKETNKEKFKGLKICPQCGNKVSGLENICQCGHLFNAVFEGESRSLESVINTLENLIIEVKSFNLGDLKKEFVFLKNASTLE
jgi:hypothetical protein